ncbi:unnamed protein product (macronuclear) [Paramecium tetraurelia]|uniref:Uncharacterized protein n=1 Tax=Paramecium tetraurelia TaxID=5888 RepID=A0BHY0_PARTE|nr:uncharacterized protein GSPATT00029183001 [Paramecium tetraurelia]CAK58147.1 unnamed protein product [Paramecium tetraurelia]|eukprot:XP_001425545.1 hypothetical protein (macronuclear) [Paramecium tetraurelia strain d4-2]
MKRERDELLQEYQKEKTDFQAFDAQIRKMQMELDLRVAILKDKESKLANYKKMIEETDLTYHRVNLLTVKIEQIVETSNRLAANLEKETQFIKDRFKIKQEI